MKIIESFNKYMSAEIPQFDQAWLFTDDFK